MKTQSQQRVQRYLTHSDPEINTTNSNSIRPKWNILLFRRSTQTIVVVDDYHFVVDKRVACWIWLLIFLPLFYSSELEHKLNFNCSFPDLKATNPLKVITPPRPGIYDSLKYFYTQGKGWAPISQRIWQSTAELYGQIAVVEISTVCSVTTLR